MVIYSQLFAFVLRLKYRTIRYIMLGDLTPIINVFLENIRIMKPIDFPYIPVGFRSAGSQLTEMFFLHPRTVEKFGIGQYQTIFETDLNYPEIIRDNQEQIMEDLKMKIAQLESINEQDKTS